MRGWLVQDLHKNTLADQHGQVTCATVHLMPVVPA